MDKVMPSAKANFTTPVNTAYETQTISEETENTYIIHTTLCER